MYVCICRVVTQSRIRAAITAGASTVDDVEKACGAGGDCGSCRDEIQDILDGQTRGSSNCDGCSKSRSSHASAA